MSYSQDVLPRYRILVGKFYADDVLWDEDSIIEFDGVPNDQMEALNEPARRKMEEYITALEAGRIKANLKKNFDLGDVVFNGMVQRPREAAYEPAPIQAGEVRLPEKDATIPLMPHLNQPGRKQRGRPAKVKAIEQPPEMKFKKSVPMMGTVLSKQNESNSG